MGQQFFPEPLETGYLQFHPASSRFRFEITFRSAAPAPVVHIRKDRESFSPQNRPGGSCALRSISLPYSCALWIHNFFKFSQPVKQQNNHYQQHQPRENATQAPVKVCHGFGQDDADGGLLGDSPKPRKSAKESMIA